MVAPVPVDSSSGCACTSMIRFAAVGAASLSVTRSLYAGGSAYGPTRGPVGSHHGRMEYPELAARTRRFSFGAPRAVSVAADGSRVVFLRSSGPHDPVDRL